MSKEKEMSNLEHRILSILNIINYFPYTIDCIDMFLKYACYSYYQRYIVGMDTENCQALIECEIKA